MIYKFQFNIQPLEQLVTCLVLKLVLDIVTTYITKRINILKHFEMCLKQFRQYKIFGTMTQSTNMNTNTLQEKTKRKNSFKRKYQINK